MLKTSELIISNKLIKSNKLIESDNINIKLSKNLKMNKIEIAAFYKWIKTINTDRDSLL